MSNLKTAALAASLLLALAGLAQAAELRLAAAAADDQVVTRLVAADPGAAAAALERQPLSAAWALDPQQPLAARPEVFVQESREYWLDASEAELQRGVSLPTTAAAALIRISPHSNNSTKLGIDDLVVRSAAGEFDGRAASQSLADTAALRAAGMDVSEGTVIVKLAPAVGQGRIELAAPAARGNYLIHVFEPASKNVLKLGAARDSVVAGDSLRISAKLDSARGESAKGLLTAPDGHSQAFEFRQLRDGSWQADVVPDAAHANGPGLWEIHAFASGSSDGARVLRDAKTAVAVARPTARFSGAVENLMSARGTVELGVGIEVAGASRYQLSGVLYGTGKDGLRRPAAYAQSAAWLEAGAQRLVLKYDAQSLAAAGLSAPYELRDLRLGNQADQTTLERRAVALELR
ncbi:DUF4785 domain-containing protein [Tahibacter harae]|uniref:DUF4785 family protein n=1 Tax=Tahibacter harae TaxID=2963937 RepID=A0ABT1QW12_9GAMM|nr:DUF4785 domain-containing protein [Tahibacter harae]MCQ4166482.1 DUF4785 family protein [Tahibacter harae]